MGECARCRERVAASWCEAPRWSARTTSRSWRVRSTWTSSHFPVHPHWAFAQTRWALRTPTTDLSNPQCRRLNESLSVCEDSPPRSCRNQTDRAGSPAHATTVRPGERNTRKTRNPTKPHQHANAIACYCMRSHGVLYRPRRARSDCPCAFKWVEEGPLSCHVSQDIFIQ